MAHMALMRHAALACAEKRCDVGVELRMPPPALAIAAGVGRNDASTFSTLPDDEIKADGEAQEQCTALQFFSQFLMTGVQIMFV